MTLNAPLNSVRDDYASIHHLASPCHPLQKITLVCFRLHRIVLGSTLLKRLASREDLVTAFKKAFKGLEPNDWQLEVTEAILLGLGCVVIAGTGSRKTMPFAMSLLVDKTKKKMVIVIFPLNDLEGDQVSILMFFFLVKTH